MYKEGCMKEIKVWDRSTRIFHWLNFTSVVGLLIVGFFMLYKKELGITSVEAKISLKALHVVIGYVFAANLIWRFVGLFRGGYYSRWAQVFPGRGYVQKLRQFVASEKAGAPLEYAGHNPKGQLAVLAMFVLLLVMMISGMVRAGTDIYYPPFGGAVSAYVAADGVDASSLVPYDKTGVDAGKMASLKAFKKPFGIIHLYSAYALMLIIFLHILSVVMAEIGAQRGIISAMFSGSKYFKGEPVDKNRD